MPTIIENRISLINTISYIILGIILLAVLGLLLGNLVLSIIGIILIVVQIIISLILISHNLISIETMTGKSRQILFFQRVEVGANP